MIRSNSMAIFGGCSDFINEQIRLDSSRITNQRVRINVKKADNQKHSVKIKKLKKIR